MDDEEGEQSEAGDDGASGGHSGDAAGRRAEQRKRHWIVPVAECVDGSDNCVLVFVKHRRPPPQQVSPELLWLPLPNLPDHAPHAIVRWIQLRRHQLA